MFEIESEILGPLLDENGDIQLDYNGEPDFDIRLHLFKDGIKYNDVIVVRRGEIYELISSNIEIGAKLLDFSMFQFPGNITLLTKLRDDWKGFIFSLKISSLEEKISSRVVSISFSPILLKWKYPYSFTEFKKKFNEVFKSTLKLRTDNKIRLSEKREEITVEFLHEFSFSLIKNEINDYIKHTESLYEKTCELLKIEELKVGVTKIFEFPEELKISCEQYLLYFATFLRDLKGIDATSNLKEEAGKVLFSVTPTDDVEALDKIREALAVYLNLPSSPVLYNDSFQSMQLKQQVENLQHSQRMKEMEMRSAQYALRLAQQNIENQDKIITQQNSFIDNQNKIIEKITSKSVMIDSLENKEELEKFCEGFEVGKSEFLIKHFGLHLNPATVLKNAGRKILGKEENKSVLGLDEETGGKD